LLHLGPGLGNAFANLHNAYKARTPIVNVVGDHATGHRPLGAPLATDIESVARPVSDWLATAKDARGAATDAAHALAAAREGGIATLILPADAGWGASSGPAATIPPRHAPPAPGAAIDAAARALRTGGNAAILIGGPATRGEALRDAARIAAKTGARLIHDTFPPRLERGAGRPAAEPLPYLTEMATRSLHGLEHLIVAGTQRPVAFFAYPALPSLLADPAATIHTLATPSEDVAAALAALAEELGATEVHLHERIVPELPTGALDPPAVGATL